MALIQEIRHVTSGPYAKETIIVYNGLATESDAEMIAQALDAEDAEGWDFCNWGSSRREELEGDVMRLEEENRQLSDENDELRDDAANAGIAQGEAEDARDEAEAQLKDFMADAGWAVEREQRLQHLEADSRALFNLCLKLQRWAGRNKAKADVLTFIKECSAQIAKEKGEIDPKFERMAA